jgi:outer membrane protein, multidrug efflux system
MAALMAVLVFAGCSPIEEPQGFWGKLWRFEVGPDYKRPEIAQVQEFRSQVTPIEANSLADSPWWVVFNDKALQTLIAQALAHNYDLQTASARVEQARSLVWVAAADLYPQVGYQALAGRQKAFVPFEEAGGNVTFNTFAGVLSAVWEIDLWGRIRRSTEAARAYLFNQEDVRRGVMLSLVSDVASGYFTLLGLDLQLAIARESARTYKQTLDLFTERFEFGRDSKLPVERAQAAYDSSLASIAAFKRAIAQQENALSVLIGAYPQEIERGLPLTSQSPPRTPPGLTTDLVQHRPDILAAEQTMIGANAEIGVAVANFFPRVGLSTLFGAQAPHIDDVVDSSFNVWSIAGSVAGPIFEGGRILESYYAQQAFWDGTIAQYKQTVLVAFREVSDALIAQDTLATQRVALQHQVKALQESVDLALLRYHVGRATYFEVLEAEQELFPAQDALAQTQRDELLAVVDLYKALGGGWNLSNAEWMQPH